MRTRDPIGTLPGGRLIREGLSDHEAGRLTVAACLVSIARTRFKRIGLVGEHFGQMPEPEKQLYTLLRGEGGDAYSRYNALLRQLTSFLNAFESESSEAKAETLKS